MTESLLELEGHLAAFERDIQEVRDLIDDVLRQLRWLAAERHRIERAREEVCGAPSQRLVDEMDRIMREDLK